MAELQGITAEAPDITGVVNQQFFIEPQGGPRHPISYLDHFPETLYNKTLDSMLVAIMYTLLGPAGVGTLKRDFLQARLDIEDNGLRTTELDALYAEPFAFARLAFETYEDDTENLLSNERWEKIQESDANYKNRAINYLKAIRAGGTVLGITLAAKSGLNHAVEVVENYRALYDKFADDELGIDFVGLTKSTEEVILLPRQEKPQSSRQTLRLLGNTSPVSGTFKLALPLGADGSGGSPLNTTITHFLPFNADFLQIQEALEALPVVGSHNVICEGTSEGSALPHPIVIRFTNELADRVLPELLVVQNTLVDFEERLVEVEITVDQVGVEADGEDAIIPTENWFFAQVAINNIKSMTTIPTPGKAPGLTKRQVPTSSFADSQFTQVLRYVTGKRGIAWPKPDGIHWVEAGIEHEGPTGLEAQQGHYVNFHNVATGVAYTETNVNESVLNPHYVHDEHKGRFLPQQIAIYPFLGLFLNTDEEFLPVDAASNPPEPLTTQAGPVALVNNIYPVDYEKLVSIIGNPPETAPFWASLERKEGADYLEIDLGKVQAVNFLTFEATQKPFDMSIAYDLIDNFPERRFTPVTIVSEREATSTLKLFYETANENPWRIVNFNVSTSLNQMIYTRFIRLGFTRRPGVFKEKNGELMPYSIEVRNLRIGRNVSP